MKITGWVRNCKNQQNICGKKTGQKTGHCKSGKTFSSGLSQETLVPIVDFLFSENPVRSVWRRNQFWESTQALDSGVYMFIKKSSLGRAVFLAALVSFLSLGFISCQPETEIQYVEKEVEKLVEKNIEFVVPGAIYNLTKDDPVCGAFSGNVGDVYFYPEVAYSTASSATNIADVTGKNENSYFSFKVFDWVEKDYVDIYFEKDSNPVYVVYNKFDDSDAADIHSGVLIFKAKYSPYGSPSVGCYYGVKFQFLEADKKLPEARTKATVYTNDLLIECGYSLDAAYNNVSDLATAVEMFAFDNTAYFSNDSWNLESSGATRAHE